MKTILVTGASTGIGRALCPALQKAGHRPVASMRDVGGRNAAHAAALRDAGIDVVEIDVADDGSVARGVAEAEPVDVLVNNAGFGLSGPMEAATIEDLKHLYETNVFGAHRTVRAVLPGMRERGEGLLVHLSSGAGRLAFPGSGAYCSSKWALEAMAETLRYELAPFGVDSVIVEPGLYDTDFHDRSLQRVSDAERLAAYAYLGDAQRRRIEALPLGDAREVVDAIVALIDKPRGQRPTRTIVRPEGPGLLQELNEVQSRTIRPTVETMGAELASNGI
jgi:NAD(P)-dependent dehydrogenase (short-subunit alcohol dehydrogenase family)